MVPFRKLLCPTDFSDCSLHGLHLAYSLAHQHAAKLIIVHVVDVLYGKQTYGGVQVEVRPDDFPQQQLQRLQRFHPHYPDVEVEHVLVEGQPAQEVLRLAKEQNCDLIVIGTHGRTGLERFILGSVAETILREAPCPVLTVNESAARTPLPS